MGEPVPELAVHFVRGAKRCRFGAFSAVTNKAGEFSIEGPQLSRGSSLSGKLCIYDGGTLIAHNWFGSNAEKIRFECDLPVLEERIQSALGTNSCKYAGTLQLHAADRQNAPRFVGS